ncbi:MAG: anaerobic ribonucleoside triphosphate reductase [Culicoidibacterales bacterium]
MIITIQKRDGKTEVYNRDKIVYAILKAFHTVDDKIEYTDVLPIAQQIEAELTGDVVSVEMIQDQVERALMKVNTEVAKHYIIYRNWRTNEREKRTKTKAIMDGIVNVEANDVNHENANMATETPAGQMMTFASTLTKDYTERYLLNGEHLMMHKQGDIHIHDLDYYPTKTLTCVQYDLAKLFKGGFPTKHGWLREPQSIQSYATLATIVFQMNQNEQHGGQAIPAFDFFMAPGVYKTFVKKMTEYISLTLSEVKKEEVIQLFPEYIEDVDAIDWTKVDVEYDLVMLKKMYQKAVAATKKETLQAMEAFIHNLNTMHSRGGNQVVFSSINYGTDVSDAGRLVIFSILEATKAGLGKGETPVFPIQVFKVKEGVSYSEADLKVASLCSTDEERFAQSYQTPNFDLFLRAVETTAKALFPNYVFLDTPFNKHEKWQSNDPERYRYEIATMGCRTRVFENVNGEKTSLGRGNISFTTINLPRLAIRATQEVEKGQQKEYFLKLVKESADIVAKQLYQRYLYQKTALAKQFPFLMGAGIWDGGESLSANEEVGSVIDSGTLGIGFIGGHNAMVALFGEGHGKNDEAYATLMETVDVLNEIAQMYKEKYKLNYSVLATPAEGLSGRFTKLDRARFGKIEGVNDRDYYINSFHIDVKEDISLHDKIRKEGPFHAKTLGGHISYIELDGEAKQNMTALLKTVQMMKDNGIGYGSINHPVDRCGECGLQTIIEEECPKCGSTNIIRMRRITGYLTGALNSWNSAKKAEEKDRVKHR